MWWWSLKSVSKEFVVINENFEFLISKSVHEPLSLLKHLFCFIILQKLCSWRRSFITLFSTSMLKSPRMIHFSYRVQQNSNRFVKYQRKYLFFWGGTWQIDANNHFSWFSWFLSPNFFKKKIHFLQIFENSVCQAD